MRKINNQLLFSLVRRYPLLFALIIIAVFVGLVEPLYLSPGNIKTILIQSAIIIVLAVAVTIPMIGGEIDLSTVSVAAMSAMIAAQLLRNTGLGFFSVVIIVLLAGLIFGLFNGILVKKRIPALLVTLGTMGVARGLTWAIGARRAVPISDATFINLFSSGKLFGIDMIFIWTLLAVGVGYIILHKTVFGTHVSAAGGDETSAMFAGVKTRTVKFSTLLFSGVVASFAGILLAARMAAGSPTVLVGRELEAIIAPIIGGVSLKGGRGNILCPVVGAIVLSMIANAVVILGFGADIQLIAQGILVVFAVAIGLRGIK